MSIDVRTVDLCRGPGGFGFTLSSQSPCVLSCILASSPAHKAGLKPGDQILYVNGSSVEKSPHELVVKLIARSPNGIVNLGVKNRAALLTGSTTADKPETHDPSDKDTVNDQILNRVDKVVEELKSGHLSISKQIPLRSNNEQVEIDEDEIVSDEELKASFTETLRSESSSDNVFVDKNHISNRRASEGDVQPGHPTHNLNRLLYPVLTPIKPDKNTHSERANSEADLRAIVGYLGSIELPGNSSLQTASLHAIRSCVRRLRAQQKVHVIFLLEISCLGIQLVDKHGKRIVTYPIKSLAFTGVCSDDKRVFGIVTKKANEGNRPSSWHEKMDISGSTVNCSCHVFTVDPEISLHEDHHSIAEKFHINCATVNGNCKEFLDSSSPILQAINELFKERTESQSFSSSQSENNEMESGKIPPDTEEGNNPGNGHPDHAQDAQSELLHNHVQEESITPNEVINECVMETPKHRIHVKVTDYRESTNTSTVQISSIEEPCKRRRVLQIERVAVFPPGKTNGIVKEQVTSSETTDLDSTGDGDMDNGRKEGQAVDLNQAGPNVSDTPSPDSQLASHNNKDTSQDLKINHFPFNSTLRLSHSAENLSHNDYDTVVSSSSNLNVSPSVCSSTQSVHSLGSIAGELSSIQGRVAQWSLGFDKLIEDPIGLKCFQEFLKKEFSEENIMFWMACEEFRNITTEKELKAAAISIFDAHLSPHATMPVNIDSSAIKLAEEHFANPTNDMYRLQQQQVYTLMKFDSYPRFLKSDMYRQCLVADIEGLTLPFDDGKPDKGKLSKKGNCLSLSSEDSECSSVSSRGSYTFEIKRSTRGWGRRSSKKSSSSYDETGEKKKSFLPWKGKQPKKGGATRPFDSQPSSTRSSLSSLSDSFPSISYSTESLEVRRESDSFQFCRVVLPDHSSTIITSKQGQTLRQALAQLCERRHMSLVATEVFICGSDRPAQYKELDADMSGMAGKEINLEHRTLFRVELSKGNLVLVKARPDQSIRDSIEPILIRYDMEYSNVVVHLVGCEVPLDSGIPVASIEHQCVVIETNDQLTGNNNGPPKINIKPPVGFSSPRRSSRRGSSIDDSIFEDIIRGRKQSLGNGYFDDAGIWIPGLKPFRSQESLNDDSFGRSFLRGPGLFGRKRKESNEKSLNKSVREGKQANIKNNLEVTELLDLLSRAQGNRMDDQRGELGKHSFELPDFLRLPQAGPTRQTENKTAPPPPPPPPVGSSLRHTTGSLKLKGETRPVVRKALSSPSNGKDDLMSELADKLRRRSTSETMSIPETRETEDSVEGLVKRSDSTSSKERSYSPWEPRYPSEHYRRINIVRPKTCTDGAVFTVEAVTPVRLDRALSPSGVPISHSESMPDVVQTRTRGTQPLTVNSIRGLPTSTGNVNRTDEQHEPEKIVRVVQAFPVQKYQTYAAKPRTLSSSSAPDYSRNMPYVYEATPSEKREKLKSSSLKRRQSDGTTTGTKGNLSPFHFPQLNARKTEIFVPATPGIKPYRIISSESKPRPKPITHSAELMAGLEEDSNVVVDDVPPIVPPPPPELIHPSTTAPRITSPVVSDRKITSPLPLPPSPVPENVVDLDIANFPPPTPLYDADSKKGVDSTPIATPNFNLSNDMTITPATNDKTVVFDSPDDGTPYAPPKDSRRDNQRLGSRLFDESQASSSRKPVKEFPKLDPYVTYESDDMRITFV